MTATIPQIRQGIADLLKQSGVTAYPYPPAKPDFPAAFVQKCDPTYDETFGTVTTTRYEIEIAVIIAVASMDLAQEQIALYMSPSGPQSLRAALADDPTLGGLVDNTDVNRMYSEGQLEYLDHMYDGALLDITVWAT